MRQSDLGLHCLPWHVCPNLRPFTVLQWLIHFLILYLRCNLLVCKIKLVHLERERSKIEVFFYYWQIYVPLQMSESTFILSEFSWISRSVSIHECSKCMPRVSFLMTSFNLFNPLSSEFYLAIGLLEFQAGGNRSNFTSCQKIDAA